ncbi:MAG: hypothetical protein CM1200mP26_27300 [Acidimicrobiales bacterium]|nr:MAG: hypothetical protein CM1200mP26_27300 [Acidimicrobiales bacterium]
MGGDTLMAAGLVRIAEAARPVTSGDADRALAQPLRAVPPTKLGVPLWGGSTVGSLGSSQRSLAWVRRATSRPGVSVHRRACSEAALRALEDASCTWADIDPVVIGKAPDFFEGLMMPELFLAEPSVGGQAHTAGPHRWVGGWVSRALVATSLFPGSDPPSGVDPGLRKTV